MTKSKITPTLNIVEEANVPAVAPVATTAITNIDDMAAYFASIGKKNVTNAGMDPEARINAINADALKLAPNQAISFPFKEKEKRSIIQTLTRSFLSLTAKGGKYEGQNFKAACVGELMHVVRGQDLPADQIKDAPVFGAPKGSIRAKKGTAPVAVVEAPKA